MLEDARCGCGGAGSGPALGQVGDLPHWSATLRYWLWMRREVRIEGRPVWIDVSDDGETVRFTLGDSSTAQTASVVETEPGVYSVLIDGKSYRARLARGKEKLLVALCGREYTLEVIDPRTQFRRSGAAHGDGQQILTAPMPGKVIRRLVEEGDQVEAGQGVLVVEAMKMQNEMKANRAGRVVSLPVLVGGTVGAGDTLAILE